MQKKQKLILSLFVVITFAAYSVIDFIEGYNELNSSKVLAYILGGCLYLFFIIFISLAIKKELNHDENN